MTRRHRGGRKRSLKDIESPNCEISEECKNKLEDLLEEYASGVLGESVKEKKKKSQENSNSRDVTISGSKKSNDKPVKEVEVVVFQSRDRKKKLGDKTKGRHVDPTKSSHSNQEYSTAKLDSAEVLKKLQFDVGSFGMKAFSKEKQREQEQNRAMKLGAKPPKRSCVNYKVFLEERKKRELESSGDAHGSQNLPFSAKSRNDKQAKIRKGRSNPHSAQIGRYKDGVLKLSSRDIKAVTKQR